MNPTHESGFYEGFLRRYLRNDPELAGAVGLPRDGTAASTEGTLTESTDAFVLSRIQAARAELVTLRSFKSEEGERGDMRVSRDTLRWYLQTVCEGESFCWHSYPVTPRAAIGDLFLSGVNEQTLVLLTRGHPIFTRQNALDYISRLHAVDIKFTHICGALRERKRRQLPTPRFVLLAALRRLEGALAVPRSEHPLLHHFREKLGLVREIGARDAAALVRLAADAIEDSVIPAHRQLASVCREMLEDAPESCSLCARPNGGDYYAYLLRKHTTSNQSPEQLHQRGIEEIHRVLEDIPAAVARLGIPPCRTPRECLNEWRPAPEREPEAEAASTILSQMEATVARVEPLLARITTLKLAKAVRVESMPDYMKEITGQGYYEPPSCLTGGAGVCHVDTARVAADRAALATLTAHETIPGHHLQLALMYGRTPSLPSFRYVVPLIGFTEGWALYAERLLGEMGFYDEDPLGELGRLDAQLRRCIRLIADTGIHAHGWSREQARIQLTDLIGYAPWLDEEINRVCVEPAAGCAYKLGELALLDLREQWRRHEPSTFDPRRFHDAVLQVGPCPFDVLREAMTSAMSG